MHYIYMAIFVKIVGPVFEIVDTNKHTNKQTNKQTNIRTILPRKYNLSG